MDTIKHIGVVESVEKTLIKVRIAQQAACSSCEVAGHCHASESKVKVIDAYASSLSHPFRVGQEVEVVGRSSQACSAVVLAFVIPFILLVSALATGILLGLPAFLNFVLRPWDVWRNLEKAFSPAARLSDGKSLPEA